MGLEVVPESQLGPSFRHCPVCESTLAGTRELCLQKQPEVWMLKCPNCKASYAERFPSADFLQALYDPSHYSSPLTSEEHLSLRCASRILQYFEVPFSQPVEIVDYGGNSGTLALALHNLLRERGHKGTIAATVVDLFPREASGALRFISPEEFATETGRYNLVIASAVLEHLPQMRKVTQELFASAQPEATFYARTPFDLPLAKLNVGYKLRWPRHLFDFGSEFWDRFCSTFEMDADVLVSRPSLVETSFSHAKRRTLLAHLLKAPEQLRRKLPENLRKKLPLWPYVGGWEFILRMRT